MNRERAMKVDRPLRGRCQLWRLRRPNHHRAGTARSTLLVMNNGTVVKLIDVHKTYRTGEVEVPAVRGVSLEIKRGEFVALMGASGSGKSTLMNLLGCLDRPTRGQYLLDNTDVSHLNRDQLADIRNGKLGFVFQSFNLLPRTSARENVELPLLYGQHQLSNQQLRERADRVLASVGLQGREEHHPVSFRADSSSASPLRGRSLMTPRSCSPDEPTGNLDSRTSIEIMGIFQELNGRGITIVMVTHESDIAAYAQRNVVLRDGLVLNDFAVAERRNAVVEMERLATSARDERE